MLYVAAGAAYQRVQALQEDGRQRALAYLGISGSGIAPDWDRMYQTLLTEEDKTVRVQAPLWACQSQDVPRLSSRSKKYAGWLVLANSCLEGRLIDRLALQDIAAHFGHHFISFLNAGNRVLDMLRKLYRPEANSPAYTLSLDMPWEERYFIMRVVDNLPGEAERQGGRTAYLAFFGSKSWEEEESVVLAELEYAHHVQSQTG